MRGSSPSDASTQQRHGADCPVVHIRGIRDVIALKRSNGGKVYAAEIAAA
jgi:hypothetical protein